MSAPESVLDVMVGARTSLADPDQPYNFVDWNSCTCGHIYCAAIGERIAPHNEARHVAQREAGEEDTVFSRAIAAVLEVAASGRHDPRPRSRLSNAVHAAAIERCETIHEELYGKDGPCAGCYRAVSVEWLDAAIAAERERQESARRELAEAWA